MSTRRLLILGLLSYFPLVVVLGAFGFVAFVLTTYPDSDPPKPLPVVGPGAMLLFGAAASTQIVLALYLPSLATVDRKERNELLARLLISGIVTLPWFWHSRLWRPYRKGELALTDRQD